MVGEGPAASLTVVGDVATLTGLSGMSPSSVGRIIYLSDATNPYNSGPHLVTAYHSATSVDLRIEGGVGVTWAGADVYWAEWLPFFFRCTVSGTSDAAMPAALATTTAAGDTILDGDVWWTSEAFPINYQPNRAYVVGERALATGDTRCIFEVVTAGTSAATDARVFNAGDGASVPPAAYGDTFTDGPDTLEWRVLDCSGITCRVGFLKIDNVALVAFTGPAINVTSSYNDPPTNADHNTFTDIQTFFCGVGFTTNGDEANATFVDKLTTNETGLDRAYREQSRVGNGGHCVWDRGLVNGFNNCYAQGPIAPSYYATGQSGATFHNCRSETVLGDIMKTAAATFTGGQTTVQQAESEAAVFSGDKCYNMTTRSRYSANEIAYTPGFNNRIVTDSRDTLLLLAESGDYYAWEYNSSHPSALSYQGITDSGAGWHALQMFNYCTRLMVGWSGVSSAEGAGNWREYEGHFCGLTSPYYWGNDAAAITDAGIRGGLRNVGDRFETQSSGLPGSWLGTVIATSGYRGTPWAPGLLAFPVRNGGAVGTAYAGFLGTVVEPSAGGTSAYIATTAGAVGATEPLQVATRWSNGLPVGASSFIVPTNANWTGYAYQASGAPGTTGAGLEPAWPTVISGTINDNGITWTCVAGAWGLQAGEITIDGADVVWTWLGDVPTSNKIGFVDDPIIAYEPRARTRLGGGADALVTTCIVDTVRAHGLTTDGTPTVIETYPLPINSAECVDYTVVAKLVGATGSAAWRVTVGAERGAAGAAALKYNPGASLLWATDGLAALVAGAVAVTAGVIVGAIDFTATGIAATNIDWEVLRQGIEAT